MKIENVKLFLIIFTKIVCCVYIQQTNFLLIATFIRVNYLFFFFHFLTNTNLMINSIHI